MILGALFRGNLAPVDIFHLTDPEYKKLNYEICELQDQLITTSQPRKLKFLDDLIAKIYAAQNIDSKSQFKFTFAAEIKLNREV